jgi:2-(1,2-epoxy-1,2-dihydrophenyl)acetyl-CoA isomerase
LSRSKPLASPGRIKIIARENGENLVFPSLRILRLSAAKISMELQTVIYEFDAGVATVTMNRPEALNAFSLQLTRDLDAAIRQAIDDKARAVIFTGRGRAFCSGGDLREMKTMWESEGRIEAFLEAPLEALHSVIRLIRETPIPFIAAVNGVCAGAGTNFALACDMILAADDASFREAFVRIGLTPDCGGTFFLPRAVGEKIAAELFMTGDALDANRALQIGMINRVVPQAELAAEAVKLAARLSAGPTAAIGRIKRMLNASFANDLTNQLALEHECQIESGRAADFKEGVAAFFDKRAPNFHGQ